MGSVRHWCCVCYDIYEPKRIKKNIKNPKEKKMEKSEWVRCPICGNKTRLQLRADTELKNFPLYCPKCKRETLIKAQNLQITVIKA